MHWPVGSGVRPLPRSAPSRPCPSPHAARGAARRRLPTCCATLAASCSGKRLGIGKRGSRPWPRTWATASSSGDGSWRSSVQALQTNPCRHPRTKRSWSFSIQAARCWPPTSCSPCLRPNKRGCCDRSMPWRPMCWRAWPRHHALPCSRRGAATPRLLACLARRHERWAACAARCPCVPRDFGRCTNRGRVASSSTTAATTTQARWVGATSAWSARPVAMPLGFTGLRGNYRSRRPFATSRL